MRDRITGELMHPIVGPLVEAAQYMTACRLQQRLLAAEADAQTDELCLLDVGLGAGNNALAAWQLSQALPLGARRLRILTTIAASPRSSWRARASMPRRLASMRTHGSRRVRCASTASTETPRSSWQLLRGDVVERLNALPPACADVVQWDAFSPAANPGLWTLRAFAALRRVCRASATVHTFSSATAVRSALLLAGFHVGAAHPKAPVPPDALSATLSAALPTKLPEALAITPSRVGTCATVTRADLDAFGTALDLRFLDRLTRSSAAFPTDAPHDALERLREHPQFAA